MTEEQWLAGTAPENVLAFPEGGGSGRKRRLFAVACCRRLGLLLDDGRSRQAVEAAERAADAQGSAADLLAAWAPVEAASRVAEDSLVYLRTHTLAIPAHACWHALQAARLRAAAHAAWPGSGLSVKHARLAARYATCVAAWREATDGLLRPSPADIRKGLEAERLAQRRLLDDLFGPPPSRPPLSLDPCLLSWRGGTVVKLAEAIYQDGRWGDMPVLADALEDAGCADETILGHCRAQGGVHARGCWLVDLLLNKG